MFSRRKRRHLVEILNQIGTIVENQRLKLVDSEDVSFWKQKEGTYPSCIFCQQRMESRKHLFSECDYSAAVWTKLARALPGTHFTKVWDNIIQLLVSNTSLHSLWRERNEKRHGSVPATTSLVNWSLVQEQVPVHIRGWKSSREWSSSAAMVCFPRFKFS